MKITINLSPAEALGIKNYLKELDEIEKPNKEDIQREIQHRVSAILQSEHEAVCDYIKEAEQKFNTKQP